LPALSADRQVHAAWSDARLNEKIRAGNLHVKFSSLIAIYEHARFIKFKSQNSTLKGIINLANLCNFTNYENHLNYFIK